MREGRASMPFWAAMMDSVRGLKTLVLKVFDVLREGGAVGVVEERGDEVDDVGGAVLEHLLADRLAAGLMVLAVGEGVRVDEAQAAQGKGIFLGKGERHIAAHGVAHHDALVDTGFVEDRFHDFGHEIHGVHVTEVLGEAVAGEVDGDYAKVVHVGEHIGAPYVETLQESVEQNQCFCVAAAFVAVVDGAAVDRDCAVLFHVLRCCYLGNTLGTKIGC